MESKLLWKRIVYLPPLENLEDYADYIYYKWNRYTGPYWIRVSEVFELNCGKFYFMWDYPLEHDDAIDDATLNLMNENGTCLLYDLGEFCQIDEVKIFCDIAYNIMIKMQPPINDITKLQDIFYRIFLESISA